MQHMIEGSLEIKLLKHGQMKSKDEKLRWRKGGRCCGAKSSSKSKCTKHLSVGPLLEVDMSKKCTPFWREARFQGKMFKKLQKTTCSDHFWKLRCRKSARRCGEAHFQAKLLKTPHVRTCSENFWTFRCPFAWQAHGIVHLVKSEQNVRVL